MVYDEGVGPRDMSCLIFVPLLLGLRGSSLGMVLRGFEGPHPRIVERRRGLLGVVPCLSECSSRFSPRKRDPKFLNPKP